MIKASASRVATLLALIFAIFACSCSSSSDDELLSLVAIDKECAAARINFKKLADESDVTYDDEGQPVLPAGMQGSVAEQIGKVMEQIADMSRFADIEKGLAYADISSLREQSIIGFTALKITDKEACEKWIADNSNESAPETAGKIETQKLKNGIFASVVGSALILCNHNATALNARLEAAAKTNASKLSLIRNHFDSDAAIAAAVMRSAGEDPDGQTSVWNTVTLNFDGPKLTGEISAPTYGDGNPTEENEIGEIDKNLLRYIPASTNILAATGKIDNFAAITDMIGKSLPGSQSMFFEMLRPYLKAIDGSMMIALNAKFDESTPTASDLIVMIHMNQEMVDRSVNDLGNLLRNLGNTPIANTPRGIVADLSSAGTELLDKVYIENRDGYLTIATFNPDGLCENEFAPLIDGTNSICYFNFDSLGEYHPAGLSFEARVRNEGTTLKAEFTGSKLPFLVELSKF